MRISDWSSDVCSSDLEPRSESVLRDVLRGKVQLDTRLQDQSLGDALVIIAFEPTEQITLVAQEQGAFDLEQIGREPFEADRRLGDRKSLVSGKSVSVSVDLGGRRKIKQQTQEKETNTKP